MHRAASTEVQVWTATRLAHCDEKREYEERNPDTVRTHRFVGGDAIDSLLLFGAGSRATPNPARLMLPYAPTDRTRPPALVSSLDVFTLYRVALTYRHAVPRALDPDRDPSSTSSSFSYLLDQDLSPPVSRAVVRASICSASHPNPFSGRRETEAIYLTVNDGRAIGNARCAKPGPTQAHCDICWHVFGVLQRETALHVASECPYSRLVIDPVLREVASCFEPPATRDRVSMLSTHDLLTEFGLLHLTGSTLASPHIPKRIGPNLAGSLALALFSRARRNAPDPSRPPRALEFSPARAYEAVMSNLCSRACHSLRLAQALDDRLTILHPGPGYAAWLEEHGHVHTWQKTWSSLTTADGTLRVPLRFADARVGPTGSNAVPSLPVRVVSRLSLFFSPASPPVLGPHPRRLGYLTRVRVSLSLGPVVGHGHGTSYVPLDPSAPSWPLHPGTPVEYPVDMILDERNPRSGRLFQVRWRYHQGQTTWEPEAHLTGTLALDRWLLRPLASYPFAMRGSPSQLDAVLTLPLRPARLQVLRNLRLAMDGDGVIRFRRTYPNTAGGVTGGRATFRDTRGKGNTFLTLSLIHI